ncbi:MAG: hypothetical protein HYT71_00415 [Candidatus Aenigmarchaeota archaeon]|nr:hypothetical protein [Candidatus Aenigmarchaeota archaeon]
MVKFLRGQYQVLEQVVLFGIGLIILTSVFSIFSLLGNRIDLVAGHDSFQETNMFLVSNAIEAYGQGRFFYNVSITLPAPRVIGGNTYQISLNKNGIHISAIGSSAYNTSSGVYNANNTAVNMNGVELSAQSPLKMIFYNNTREFFLRR